jgi:hypothetical protein
MAVFQTRTKLGPFYVGEVPLPLQVTIQDADGVVIDISAYTGDMVIERVDGGSVTGIGAGAISFTTDGEDGAIEYAWLAADFSEAGRYRAQMWIDDSINTLASEIYEFDVLSGTGSPF